MTRKEKKEELIGLFAVGAIFIGDLIDECFEFGQQHPRWISVEDELPKENGRYLFYHTITGVQSSYYYNDLTLDKAVTHWMPLPPPVVSKSENAHIIGTAEHIQVALDVMERKGGEK